MKIAQIKQLTTDELMKMSDKEFNKIFKQVQDLAHKRAKALASKGYTNWAYERYVKVEGEISKKRVPDKKDRAMLVAELKRGISFISKESTTVKGYEKRVRMEIEFRTGESPNIYDEQFYRDFAQAEALYGKIRELRPDIIHNYGSENVRNAVNYVIQYFPNENDVDKIDRVKNYLENNFKTKESTYENLGFY